MLGDLEPGGEQEPQKCDEVNNHILELQQYLTFHDSNSIRQGGPSPSSSEIGSQPVQLMHDSTEDSLKSNRSSCPEEVTESNRPSESASEKSNIHCKYCRKTFYSIYGLRKHEGHYDLTKGGQTKCSKCAKVLYSKDTLKKHMRIHTGERPHECKLCHDRFIDTSSIRYHERTHHSPSNPNKCKFCFRTFQTHIRLEKHLPQCRRFQPGEAPSQDNDSPINDPKEVREDRSANALRCFVCVRTFTRCSVLKKHLEDEHADYADEELHREQGSTGEESSGSSDRKLECRYCRKKFSCVRNVQRHQTFSEVSEMKRYKCSKCPKELNSKNYLVIHMRLHSGERPIKCMLCQERFVDTSSLRKHERRYHSAPDSFKCGLCSHGFQSSTKLKKHISVCRRNLKEESHDESLDCPQKGSQDDGGPLEAMTEQTMTLVNKETLGEFGNVYLPQSLESHKRGSSVDCNRHSEVKTEHSQSFKNIAPEIECDNVTSQNTQILEIPVNDSQVGCEGNLKVRTEEPTSLVSASSPVEFGDDYTSRQAQSLENTENGSLDDCEGSLKVGREEPISLVSASSPEEFGDDCTSLKAQTLESTENGPQDDFEGNLEVAAEELTSSANASPLESGNVSLSQQPQIDLEQHLTESEMETKACQPTRTDNRNRCDVCMRILYNAYGLREHKKLHTGEKDFQCNLCGEKFSRKYQVNNHVKKYHRPDSLRCSVCLQTFLKCSDLKQHMENKHPEVFEDNYHEEQYNERGLKCKYCGKMFSRHSSLASHLSRVDKYKCSECSKELNSEYYLSIHMRRHTGERPVECLLCPRRFFDSSGLRKHEKQSHSAPNSFKCSFCFGVFSSNAKLKQHTCVPLHQNHHTEKTQDGTLRSPGNSLQNDRGHPQVEFGTVSLSQNAQTDFGKPVEIKQQVTRTHQGNHSQNDKGPPDTITVQLTPLTNKDPPVEFGNVCLSENPQTDFGKPVEKSQEVIQISQGSHSQNDNGHTEAITGQLTPLRNKDHPVEFGNVCLSQNPLRDTGKPVEKRRDESQRNQGNWAQHNRGHLEAIAEQEDTANNHITQSSGTDALRCMVCLDAFRKCSELKQHMEDNHPEFDEDQCNEGKLKCRYCRKMFTTPKSLAAHLNRVDRYKCKECSKELSSEKYLSVHMRIHTGERPVECLLCPRRFIDQSALRKHEKRLHSAPNSFKCSFCFKVFGSNAMLKQHIPLCRSLHVQKNRDAAQRSQGNSSQTEAITVQSTSLSSKDPEADLGNVCSSQNPYKHFESPKGGSEVESRYGQVSRPHQPSRNDKSYMCNVCMKVLSSEHSLKLHTRHHTNDKPFQCNQCSERFFYKYQVNDHVKMYHGPDALRCMVCVLTFPKCSLLKQHIEVNHPTHVQQHLQNEEPECKYCRKTFLSWRNLKCHHRSPKTYKCSKCPKELNTRQGLVVHERRHSGERPVQCILCHDRFIDTSALKKHERRQHSDSHSFKCEYCSKTFPSHPMLQAHDQVCRQHPRENKQSESGGSPASSALHDASVGEDLLVEQITSSCEIDPLAMNSKSLTQQPEAELGTSKEGSVAAKDGDVAENHQEASNMKVHRCSMCLEEFNSAAELKEHATLHTGEKPFRCNTCHEGFYFKYQVQLHVKTFHGQNAIKCLVCVQTFPNCSTLKKHMEKRHPDNVEATEPKGTKALQCNICMKVFERKSNFSRHMNYYHRKSPPVSERIRRVTVNKEERQYLCSICGKTFDLKASLIFHTRTHSNVRPFKCSTCNKAFRQRSTLHAHEKRHGSKDYMCELCSKLFYTKGELHKHTVIVHLKAKYAGKWKCEICSKVLGCRISWRSHMNIHSTNRERRYKCDFCDYRAWTSGSLAQHVRSHVGERKHKCDVCGKRFLEKKHLNNHFRLHTGETPWKCDVCHMGFAQQAGLYWHKKRNKCNMGGGRNLECERDK